MKELRSKTGVDVRIWECHADEGAVWIRARRGEHEVIMSVPNGVPVRSVEEDAAKIVAVCHIGSAFVFSLEVLTLQRHLKNMQTWYHVTFGSEERPWEDARHDFGGLRLFGGACDLCKKQPKTWPCAEADI